MPLLVEGTRGDIREKVAEAIRPIDDIRSIEAYRRRVAKNVLGEFHGV